MQGVLRVCAVALLLAAACDAAADGAPRIVSCAPAATETIFDLGGEGCLVGRSSACLYPAAATNLPSVGAYSAPSLERIVALAPTHVLMTYISDPSMSNRLERLGIRVLQFPCERLADYAPMRARLAALCGLAPRRMLAVVQREPMIVAGRDTLPDDVLAEVGCANAVTNRTGYFVLSPESRLKLAPDGEVDFSMDYDLTRLGPKLPEAIANLRQQLAAPGGRASSRAAAGGRASSRAATDALFWLRLWRVLAGLLVGASLALAGAVLQTVLRNPLADPFVLGLSGGASLAASFVLATGLAAAGAFVLPTASFIGAVAALLVVAAVARA
ncbi:MAG: iron chelate uptake ABC transporter family permease subunit, partial [Kiritimatiellae bacterium]|nr:iron chelate uptake ABC transporter family permease subunit [Kiritimatiellia bacterium]